jgi:hypothetical protein
MASMHVPLVESGIVLGDLFLGSNKIRPNLLSQHKRLPRMWTARRKCTWTSMRNVRVMCIKSLMQNVHQF